MLISTNHLHHSLLQITAHLKPDIVREEEMEKRQSCAEADLGTMRIAFRAAHGGKSVEVIRAGTISRWNPTFNFHSDYRDSSEANRPRAMVLRERERRKRRRQQGRGQNQNQNVSG